MAGKAADYAALLGLDLAPEIVLHPSVTERFARAAPGVSAGARRTLRTNLRFIARQVVPQLYPADVPLPRERAKVPYSPAEIGGYLALADAQPTLERRMRAPGLVCPGAGTAVQECVEQRLNRRALLLARGSARRWTTRATTTAKARRTPDGDGQGDHPGGRRGR